MPPLSVLNHGRGQTLLGSGILFLVIPYPFVILRIWARWMKKTRLVSNDYIILLALPFVSGYNIATIVDLVKGGYGQHLQTLNINEIISNLKVTVAVTLLWTTANTLIKLSVLHFYKTIFHSQGLLLLYTIYTVGVLTMLYWASTVITAFAICRPFEFNWNKLIIGGKCGDILAYYLSTGIVNLMIDVLIVALPLPVLWKLHVPMSRKISLMIIFSLGALICVISIVRVFAITQLDFTDPTYTIVLESTTTALEPTLGVINACLPLLQPVVSRVGNSKALTWFKSLTFFRSSTKGALNSIQHSGNPNSGHFQRLTPDLYPLTEVSIMHQSHKSSFPR